MKKLMIVAAVACMAAVTQAATYNWNTSFGSVYNGYDSTAGIGKTWTDASATAGLNWYLICSDTISQGDLLAAYRSGGSLGDYALTSGTTTTAGQTLTTSFAFAEQSVKASRPSAGHLEVKGSQKGKIALVNNQSRVAVKDLEEVAAVIEKQTMCRAEVGDGKGAQVIVEIVDRKGESALTVYPEDRKSIVNVDGLAKGLSGEAVSKFLPSRCRKEVLRAFCYSCGAGGSQFPNNVLAISKISDLDLVDEFIPGDAANACQKRLKDYGVTPKQMVSYFAACRQGWAPTPTNEAQKAVWDRVHAPPKNPMKIEFDPKKGR